MKDVITIDCHYIDADVAASFLLPEKQESILIEANTRFASEIILNAVIDQGLKPEDIRHLILTHIHLDHSAGAGHLMEMFPRAEILCHPLAARHLINPERLIKSAKMVYGEERFNALYGEIKAVDADRIKTVEDGYVFEAGRRKLTFYHTAGHAKHHICIHDSLSNGIFTGDSFGLAYPLLQKNGLMIYPATTAVDFDPEAARKSIQTIMASGSNRAYLTHFGELKDMQAAEKLLLEGLNEAESIMNSAAVSDLPENEIQKFCRERFTSYIDSYLDKLELSLSGEERKMLEIDIEINAGGIAYAALRKRKKEH